MRTFVYVALVLAMAALTAGKKVDPGVNCVRSNDCQGDKDNIYCRQTNSTGPNVWNCVQCMVDNDCDVTEFCVKTATTFDSVAYVIGQCAPQGKPLGERCDPNIVTPVRGTNEQLFCGLVTDWNNATNTPKTLQWSGYCIAKSCYACMAGVSDGDRMCFTQQVSGRGGFWSAYRNGDNTYFGINQNATNQLLITEVIFTGLILLLLLCTVGRAHMKGGVAPRPLHEAL